MRFDSELLGGMELPGRQLTEEVYTVPLRRTFKIVPHPNSMMMEFIRSRDP